ncbi:AAA family ATPase [Micromonospora sp. DT201]|uniref:AAA family ATPase n=1 Tax=Micromonospora sp. DT201 TaxID=3393442 RepID=UPI003CEF6747
MQFQVISRTQRQPQYRGFLALLVAEDWDDFGFRTQFNLLCRLENGEVLDIGQVKIGQFGMGPEQRRPLMPETFAGLGEEFFSVGQDDSYYQRLDRIGRGRKAAVLTALRDIALHEDLFERALYEDVTGTSLLRSVQRASVEGQFRRLASGGDRLSPISFSYTPPRSDATVSRLITLHFDVQPGSSPPTNIHVLIGPNGVGKTHLLNNMARALAEDHASQNEVGLFQNLNSDQAETGFANLVSVTFSAFDVFEPIRNRRNKATGLQYTYVGLKRVRTAADDRPLAPKSPAALAREFGLSVKVCLQGARLTRWRKALLTLEADPIFCDAGVAELAASAMEDEELRQKASKLFRSLSSGHKIVLLTVTRLVESVEERSLVLLDEPEAHLHPPLLSAFIRALSDLLVERNGVAIIATHSPVVLQEVPAQCSWKLRRSAGELVAERPVVETFGENVGVLTREVFGLEVTRSGFHQVVREIVGSGASYEQLVDRLDGQVGGEARALGRGLIAAREAEVGL